MREKAQNCCGFGFLDCRSDNKQAAQPDLVLDSQAFHAGGRHLNLQIFLGAGPLLAGFGRKQNRGQILKKLPLMPGAQAAGDPAPENPPVGSDLAVPAVNRALFVNFPDRLDAVSVKAVPEPGSEAKAQQVEPPAFEIRGGQTGLNKRQQDIRHATDQRQGPFFPGPVDDSGNVFDQRLQSGTGYGL